MELLSSFIVWLSPPMLILLCESNGVLICKSSVPTRTKILQSWRWKQYGCPKLQCRQATVLCQNGQAYRLHSLCDVLFYVRICWLQAEAKFAGHVSVRGGKENWINLLKSTGHVMHQQFNILQLYVLPTLYLCVLYLSENKQRLVPLTA